MSDVSGFFAGNFVHLGLGATTVAPPMHTADGEWSPKRLRVSHARSTRRQREHDDD